MSEGKYALFIWTIGFSQSGYYCGVWTQYGDYFPVMVDSIDDNSTYQSKRLKTYTSIGRAIRGAKSCLNNIGYDWIVRIVDINNPDTKVQYTRHKKRLIHAYDHEGKPIMETVTW